MPGVCRCDLTNACAFYHYHCTRGYRAHRAPGIPCALSCERAGNSGSNLAQTRGEIAKLCLRMMKLCLRMMPFEIDSVGWAKGALAPCPPSISSLILNGGHAFHLRSSSFALRASADKVELRRTLLPTLRNASRWIASRSLSTGAHSRDQLARK